MNIKKINQVFAYLFFAVGALKIVLVILAFTQLSFQISAIASGGYHEFKDYSKFGIAIGFLEIILLISSIIMIIVNIKKEPEVLKGYLIGIGAVILELITPSLFSLYMVFVECGMYMKAGIQINGKNLQYGIDKNTSKKIIKSTEWFYANDNNITMNEKKNSEEPARKVQSKQEMKKEKIEKEISEWKILLDSGEIDQETYESEKNRLIKKIDNIK